MKLYIVHELEVSGDASIADMRAVVWQASEGFRAALEPVGAARFHAIKGGASLIVRGFATGEDLADLAAFVAAEVCK